MTTTKTLVWLICASFYWPASSETIMFPNERTSLDDCRLRFYRIESFSAAAPANGKPTRIREFPHMAAIGWTEPADGGIRWQCGGSLVWENWVLTAAHCAVDSRGKVPDVVRLGDIDLYSADDDEWVQQFRVVKIVRHPEHRFAAGYHDVALLKLDRNVVEDGTVIPACLWTDEEVRFRELVATGWGRTGVGADFTPKLLQVSLKPISNEECSEFYGVDRKLMRGLEAQHLCARDEAMDTCEGDSGGPLQFKLMHNGRMTPFIVGVTSFGAACGVSLPGVYARVSTYFRWIVDTMRLHGAEGLDANYNETYCALRYVTYREYDKRIAKTTDNYTSKNLNNLRIYQDEPPRQLAQIRWNGKGPNCYGVIVDEDTVLTIADCTIFNGKSPTFVTYLKNKVAPISKIVVHPQYTRESAYNNIAILKLSNLLDLPLNFRPSCIWHGFDYDYGRINAFGKGRRDINRFIDYGEGSFLDPRQMSHLIQADFQIDCIISKRFLPRMPLGLGQDHLCVGNDVFLVPGSCEHLPGSMLGKPLGHFYHTVALSLLARDCGFGEHLIATRLFSHVSWMQSVLLPNFRDSSAVHFVDADLREGSSCTLGRGITGRCVPASRCSNQLKQSQGRITFCSSGSIICCSPQNIDNHPLHRAILDCPKLLRNIAADSSNGSLVNIGWTDPNVHCSGSVINARYVLTSVSCLRGKSQPPSFVRLVESGIQRDVLLVRNHPGYNATDRSNDLALVRLKEDLEWSSSVHPVCLWTNVTHTPIELDVNYPTNNFYAPRKLHPMYGSDCQRTHPHVIRDSQLCTRSPYEDAVCVTPGDQLIWADPDDAKVRFLVGLSTNACDPKLKYSVFTRISSHLEWISANAFSVANE